ESICLGNCPLGETDILAIPGSSSLVSLEVSGDAITDSVTERIVAAFPKLSTLALTNTKVTNRCFSKLKRLKRLSSLVLKNNKQIDGIEGIAELKSIDDLETLDLSFTGVTSKCATQFAVLKNLKSLNLEGNRIDDSAINELGKLTQLRIIWLSWTQI